MLKVERFSGTKFSTSRACRSRAPSDAIATVSEYKAEMGLPQTAHLPGMFSDAEIQISGWIMRSIVATALAGLLLALRRCSAFHVRIILMSTPSMDNRRTLNNRS
ncbi:hypothetical protein X747_22520 [Mesorhizobium sp. LNJC384A00]|nr:hypothetical protein X750_32230 [Mesorhizobium sp. LNJC394B00]ESY39637.1 hypothetical protein X747_22520 [Mesorhizobium sp. LNJC384A00]